MKKSFKHIHSWVSILIVLFFVVLSCNEDDKLFEASPDMLVEVRTTELVIELESDNESKKEELNKKITDFLSEKNNIQFYTGYVYEMKLDEQKTLDIYKSKKDFKDGDKAMSGTYAFKTDTMIVSFSVEGYQKNLLIEGSLASVFYNHFVRKTGSGEHHIIDAEKVFCLRDDYTEELKEEYKESYPDVKINNVGIKTYMMTIRQLETFK